MTGPGALAAFANEARVLVLDNEASEALPVLLSLSRFGVPAVWFSDDSSLLPPEGSPLPNIRLALLDIDLVAGGATSPRQMASTLTAYVQRLIPKDAPGLMVVLWTKHAEMKEEVLAALVEAGGPIPIAIETLEKADFLLDHGDDPSSANSFDISKLGTRIAELLTGHEPWRILLHWERTSRQAASETVSSLSRLAQEQGAPPTEARLVANWQSEVIKSLNGILRRLAQEDLGTTHLQNGTDLLEGIYSVLGTILHDQAEAAARQRAAELAADGSAILTAPSTAVGAKTAAQLNSSIALAQSVGPRAWSGNIYGVAGEGALRAALEATHPANAFRSHISGIVIKALGGNSEKQSKNQAAFPSAVLDEVLVDVHPACDHAQDKIQCARFVAGIRLSDSIRLANLPDSIWTFGPLYDAATNQSYNLILDLHSPVVASKAILRSLGPPWRRLRQAVVADLLSKLSAHGGRQGVLRVRA